MSPWKIDPDALFCTSVAVFLLPWNGLSRHQEESSPSGWAKEIFLERVEPLHSQAFSSASPTPR